MDLLTKIPLIYSQILQIAPDVFLKNCLAPEFNGKTAFFLI